MVPELDISIPTSTSNYTGYYSVVHAGGQSLMSINAK